MNNGQKSKLGYGRSSKQIEETKDNRWQGPMTIVTKQTMKKSLKALLIHIKT